jgi:phenylalanyl-tRNA synthetase alpha chain
MSLAVGLKAVQDGYVGTVAVAANEQEIRAAQAAALRRVNELMRGLRDLPLDERKRAGETANSVKRFIEAETEKRLAALVARARKRDLERVVDVTLPGRAAPAGHLHILTQVRRDLAAIFAELGFEVATGPQVETDFHNFEALAIPAEHPSRDAQDTFYVESSAPGVVLRTHTSPVQIRTMLARRPPVRIIAPGVVYRRDDDATHSPMFSQLEALVVDRGIRMSDLKGVLLHFIGRFFGAGLGIRFRSSYFPFVEPGAEVDMQCAFCRGRGTACRLCKGTGWIELGGAGMVDPRVFAHVGYDPEEVSGFAFGFGIERMAMLRHGVNDIKLYFENDVRFLRQF